MRVISQDGKVDIPYELTAVTIGNKGDLSEFIINMRSKLLDERPCIVATYSTEAKALNAMEMLRYAYKQFEKATNNTSFTMFDKPKIFQFPKDEDMEV